MSSPERSIAALVLAGAVSLLAGCGFHPLYGRDSVAHTPGASAYLASIEIPSLPDERGLILRNLLIDAMHAGGPSPDYRYRLNIVVREADIELGLQQNSTSTRGQLRLTAEYWLIDNGSGKTLLHETLRSSSGYNILVNQFGTVLSADDARQRGLKQIADDMTEHLALYFSKA